MLDKLAKQTLKAGFGGFDGGEGLDHGVDLGVAEDGFDAVVEAGEEEGAAFVLRGD